MKTKRLICTFCRKKLELGADAMTATKGLMGHRRYIPLEEPQYFCCESCLSSHYGNGTCETLRRTP